MRMLQRGLLALAIAATLAPVAVLPVAADGGGHGHPGNGHGPTTSPGGTQGGIGTVPACNNQHGAAPVMNPHCNGGFTGRQSGGDQNCPTAGNRVTGGSDADDAEDSDDPTAMSSAFCTGITTPMDLLAAVGALQGQSGLIPVIGSIGNTSLLSFLSANSPLAGMVTQILPNVSSSTFGLLTGLTASQMSTVLGWLAQLPAGTQLTIITTTTGQVIGLL